MARVRVSELAKRLNTSTTTVYKHMKRLQERLSAHIIKEPGTTYLSEEGAEIVKASMQATTTTPEAPAMSPAVVSSAVDLAPLSGRLESMEKALLAVAEELRATRQEVSTLRGENAALRVLLLPPAPIAAPVEVWQPEPARPDPAARMNFFERVFCELFHPDRLRRCAP